MAQGSILLVQYVRVNARLTSFVIFQAVLSRITGEVKVEGLVHFCCIFLVSGFSCNLPSGLQSLR